MLSAQTIAQQVWGAQNRCSVVAATAPERFCPRRRDSKLLTACAKSRRPLFVCGEVLTRDFAHPTQLRLPASNVSIGSTFSPLVAFAALPHGGELDVAWWCAGPGAMKIALREFAPLAAGVAVDRSMPAR
jgi:hypothetical protein